MKDRILHFLALENLSPTRFADLIGVQRSGVSHILAGRNKPSFDFIEKMLHTFPNLSAEWLVMGTGEVYKNTAVATPVAPSLFDEQEVDKKDVEPNYEPQPIKSIPPAQPPKAGKTVESITVFYTDKTFSIYHPE